MSELGSAVSRTILEDLLARAADDWVDPSELLEIVGRAGVANRELRRTAAIGLVAQAVCLGYVTIGDVWEKHVSWPLPPGDALLRLARDWSAVADPYVLPGDLFWIDATPEGEAVGRAVWAREAASE